MMPPRRGMGRGLDAILAVSGDRDTGRDLREIPVGAIAPNPKQPRRRFEEGSLKALAESLKERGVLQPVLVRPGGKGRYELIAGERRWRAAQMAGLESVPAILGVHDDAEALELALVENMAREDLNPVEQARACAALVEELGLTREQVGRRVGRGRVSVSNLIRLLDLPDEALSLLEDGRLSEGHGRALLLAEDHAARRRLTAAAAAEGWSVRAVEAHARRANDAKAAEGAASKPGGSRDREGGDGAGRRRRGGRRLHPDQEAACIDISDSLERLLGAEVAVRCARDGSYHAEIVFTSAEEAQEMARRLQR